MQTIINLRDCHWFNGLGDATLFAHIPDVIWNCKPHQKEVFEAFGIETCESGGIRIDDAYLAEMKDHGRRCRLDYITDIIYPDQTITYKTPTLCLTPDELAKAKKTLNCIGRPTAICFPESHRKEREWPLNNWIDLSAALRDKGLTSVFVTESEDEIRDCYQLRYQTVREVMSLVAVADIVVGGDSWGIHLGGIMSRPTVVLLGPTAPTVFGVYDLEVLRILGEGSCTGCHWRQPFRPACQVGCRMLQFLEVEGVAKSVADVLARNYDAASDDLEPGEQFVRWDQTTKNLERSNGEESSIEN